jgi:hypothetical protein
MESVCELSSISRESASAGRYAIFLSISSRWEALASISLLLRFLVVVLWGCLLFLRFIVFCLSRSALFTLQEYLPYFIDLVRHRHDQEFVPGLRHWILVGEDEFIPSVHPNE